MALGNDVVYLFILLVTIAASFFGKRCSRKSVFYGLFGLALVWSICGVQLFHSLFVVVINLAITNILTANCSRYASFAFCFGYLTFFRCSHFIGLPDVLPYSNAVQLLVTLRCVGLTFEIKDAEQKAPKSRTFLHFRSWSTWHAVLNQFFYCYNVVGLFTGPYFTYKVHEDMVKNVHLHSIRYAHEIIPRLCAVPIYIGIFLIGQHFFPVEAVHLDDFYQVNGFIARLFYMVPVFVQLRVRCYTAWSLSETACIVAGLGAYPQNSRPKCGQGPTDPSYEGAHIEKCKTVEVEKMNFSFETIRNIDPMGCEFSSSFREAMRCWNKTVQYWLAVNVYKRAPKSARTFLTMLVSAYWHGIHPGYFLSFLTIPLCLLAEDLFFYTFDIKDLRGTENSVKNWTFARKLWWFVRMRGFEYMGMGFLLLTWSSTVRYWSSIYFLFHCYLSLTVIVCLILMCCFGKMRRKND